MIERRDAARDDGTDRSRDAGWLNSRLLYMSMCKCAITRIRWSSLGSELSSLLLAKRGTEGELGRRQTATPALLLLLLLLLLL